VARTATPPCPKVAYLPFSTGTTTKPTQAQQGTATEGGTTLRYQNERLVNLNILVFTNALITSEHSFFIRSKTKDHHTTSVPVPFHPYLMAKCAPRKTPLYKHGVSPAPSTPQINPQPGEARQLSIMFHGERRGTTGESQVNGNQDAPKHARRAGPPTAPKRPAVEVHATGVIRTSPIPHNDD